MTSDTAPSVFGSAYMLQPGELESARSLFTNRITLGENPRPCREYLQSLPIQMW
jgi:hypothetical protein